MPRRLYNWTFHDVVSFLKDHGFRHNHTEGSHFFYVGVRGNRKRNVCIPYHGKQTLKPRTLKGIIQQSGIPQKEWIR